MRGQRLETFGGFDVPNADGFVEGTRHDQIRLRVKVAAKHVVGMSLQRLHALARGQFPDFQRLVVRGGDQETGIAGPGHVGDAESVAGNGLLEFAVVSAPDFDQLVGGGRGQPFAVGREFDGRNGFRVTGQSEFEGVVGLGRGGRRAGSGGRGCAG